MTFIFDRYLFVIDTAKSIGSKNIFSTSAKLNISKKHYFNKADPLLWDKNIVSKGYFIVHFKKNFKFR